MKTTFLTHQYEGVIQQIVLHYERDGKGLDITNMLRGQWNTTQSIFLSDPHIQSLVHLWEAIIDSAGETFTLVDTLDQRNQCFEIVHLNCNEECISLYRATGAGVENCTLAQKELRDILNWYLNLERAMNHDRST